MTPAHEDIQQEAAKHKASTMEFGLTDIAKWQTDPGYLIAFKERFVYENRDLVKAAAKKYDLPEGLVAGVLYNEIGGKDPVKDSVYLYRSVVPGTADKDRTSLGQQAIQVRRAAESLGYDPKSLTAKQREEILASLHDPAQSIFIAAKHLSDLRDLDFPAKHAAELTIDDIKVVGARYNIGPDRPSGYVRGHLSYGEAIAKRYARLNDLLEHEPPEPDYAPLRPLSRAFEVAEAELESLYGVPR